MNEQACAFVCAIFSLLCFVLSAYSLKTGDMAIASVIFAYGLVVVLLSGYVVLYRFL